MIWFLLASCFILCVAGACISYSTSFKETNKFYPSMIFLGAALAAAWGWAVRLIETKEQLYVYSLFWDSLILFAYYAVPLIYFNVKLNWGMGIGSALVIIGLVVAKAYS